MVATDLNKLRSCEDPEADEVFNKVVQNGHLAIINQNFLSLTQNNSPIDSLPDYFQQYLKTTKELPEWVDQKKIKIAQDLYALYGLEISTILLFKSLPQSYCCANGAKVLSTTGRLARDQKSFNKYSRRIMETSYFVMQVLTPGSFTNTGSAIITTQKTRLIHASIRYYIKKEGWDAATYGEPINQQDMLGTLMSFSALIVEGIESLDIVWTDKEKDAFIHCWNVIGYILGVKEEMLPPDYKTALELGYAIFNDQKAHSLEGVELTNALISFVQHIIPGTAFDSIPGEMIHYLLGNELAELLEVKRDELLLQGAMPDFFKVIWGISDTLKDHSSIMRAITRPFSRMVLQGVLFSYSNSKGLVLLIPPSLQENWELHTSWVNMVAMPSLLGKRIAIQRRITGL